MQLRDSMGKIARSRKKGGGKKMKKKMDEDEYFDVPNVHHVGGLGDPMTCTMDDGEVATARECIVTFVPKPPPDLGYYRISYLVYDMYYHVFESGDVARTKICIVTDSSGAVRKLAAAPVVEVSPGRVSISRAYLQGASFMRGTWLQGYRYPRALTDSERQAVESHRSECERVGFTDRGFEVRCTWYRSWDTFALALRPGSFACGTFSHDSLTVSSPPTFEVSLGKSVLGWNVDDPRAFSLVGVRDDQCRVRYEWDHEVHVTPVLPPELSWPGIIAIASGVFSLIGRASLAYNEYGEQFNYPVRGRLDSLPPVEAVC
jgi:hypothetical protein